MTVFVFFALTFLLPRFAYYKAKNVSEFIRPLQRDLEEKWGKPEVPYNVNHTELGDLKLTQIDIDALVAFMKTLTDGYENENENN